MKITKLGHCCLLIETKGKRLLTDPGCYTVELHSKLENIDAILFTHEHRDHFHLDSLKELLIKNVTVKIFTNVSTANLLAGENIQNTVIEDGESVNFEGIVISGHGLQHDIQHPQWGISANTGYFIDERLFYPGDALTDPKKPVDILALPVAGGWLSTFRFMEYALQVKPRIAFPVHDHTRFPTSHAVPKKILPENGIEFIPMIEGDTYEF